MDLILEHRSGRDRRYDVNIGRQARIVGYFGDERDELRGQEGEIIGVRQVCASASYEREHIFIPMYEVRLADGTVITTLTDDVEVQNV